MLSYRESGTACTKRSLGGRGCDQAGRSLLPPRTRSLCPPCLASAGMASRRAAPPPGRSRGSQGSSDARREASGPRPLLKRSWEGPCRYSRGGSTQDACAPRSEAGSWKRRAVSRCSAQSSNHSFTCPKGVASGLSGSLLFQVCPM